MKAGVNVSLCNGNDTKYNLKKTRQGIHSFIQTIYSYKNIEIEIEREIEREIAINSNQQTIP